MRAALCSTLCQITSSDSRLCVLSCVLRHYTGLYPRTTDCLRSRPTVLYWYLSISPPPAPPSPPPLSPSSSPPPPAPFSPPLLFPFSLPLLLMLSFLLPSSYPSSYPLFSLLLPHIPSPSPPLPSPLPLFPLLPSHPPSTTTAISICITATTTSLLLHSPLYHKYFSNFLLLLSQSPITALSL